MNYDRIEKCQQITGKSYDYRGYSKTGLSMYFILKPNKKGQSWYMYDSIRKQPSYFAKTLKELNYILGGL